MELSDVVCSTNPCLLTVRGQAVATTGVACSYNEHILWDRLHGGEEGTSVNTYDTRAGDIVGDLHFHQMFYQQ